MRLSGALAVILVPAAAYAHATAAPTLWTWAPGVVAPLVASAVLYGVGLARVWRAAAPGRGISLRAACAFAAGWVALAAGLVSPLHRLGEQLFAAHMVQHEVLMVVAAPLLVLGRPLIAFLWALPPGARRTLGRVAARPALERTWRVASGAVGAWVVHAVVLWGWHAPALFEATRTSDAVHALQHASFLGAALLFWWSLLGHRSGATGAAIVSLFTTSVHTSVLGALLVVSPRPWYPGYGARAAAWGLTALEDQQLGGLVMWVPAGLVYVGIGLWLVARWLRESAVRVTRREAVVGVLLLVAFATSGCGDDRAARAARMTGGDPHRGRALLVDYGCRTCHTIPGVPGADALVGPPLGGLARRVYIAGVVPNTPDNMTKWIRRPREIDEHTAMPDLDVTDVDARDIAAYLYTLE